MTGNMWYSKDDMLKDLAECTGVPINDFDDEYIVRGSSPPPPLKLNESDDDEFKLRFGGCGDQLTSNDSYGPDLAGITKMLRMVDTYNEPPEQYQPRNTNTQSPRNKETRQEIVIKKPVLPRPPPNANFPSARSKQIQQTTLKSELNPNVKEFVPKTWRNANVMEDNENLTNDKNVANNEVNLNTTLTKTNTDHDINAQGKSNNSDTSSEDLEKQTMIALLKSKISAASKEQSWEKKREKNVAMAALLRLNSRPPASPIATKSSTSASPTPKCTSPSMKPEKRLPPPEPTENPKQAPLVLFTPEYFAGPSCSPKVLNIDDCELNIPETKPIVTPLKTPSPEDINDSQIKESIDKVKNWLNSPDKKKIAKTHVPYIGQVVFKKKDLASPNSPSSEVSSKKAETVNVIPSYVPSKYAEELARDMEARVKAKKEKELKDQPPLDMWTKLEMELKARDQLIKERAGQTRDDNQSQTSSPSHRRL